MESVVPVLNRFMVYSLGIGYIVNTFHIHLHSECI